MNEKVEILLATYNGEKYIRQQLDSIIVQDYKHWVIRACDDASKDATYDILLEYKANYPDKFVVQKNEKGFGSAKLNFMNLIQSSTSQYVMCCDQDDVWLPNKISLTLEEMKRNEGGGKPVLIHTDLKVVDQELNVLSESFFEYSKLKKDLRYNDLLIQNSVTGCTTMLNKELVLLLKREINVDNILMHDWIAALVAAAMGKISFVDQPTMLYRQHSVNSVGAKRYGISLFIEKLKNSNIKKSLLDTVIQAGEVAKIYKDDFNVELYQLTEHYSRIFEKSKLQRVSFYMKNKIFKKGLPRKICQIILG